MPRYQNSSFDGGQDRLLNAIQYRESVDKRVEAQKNTFRQDMGLILEAQRNDIASAQFNNTLDQQFKKNAAAKAIADFSAVYDPTDTDHRAKLDWYKNWGIGEGMSGQETSQGFANADNKTAAMDAQLASLRAQSGIQDWETTQTQDGRKIIDVASTISKSNYMKEQLDKEAASWTTSDRQLESLFIQNNTNGASRAEIREKVNENRRTLEDYKTVIGQELWNPPKDFAQKFAIPIKGDPQGGGVANDSIGYVPRYYDRQTLELEPGYLKARAYAKRVERGEQPVFVTEDRPIYKKDSNDQPVKDARGNPIVDYTEKVIRYDQNGVAIIKDWLPTKEYSQSQEAAAKATSAQVDAEFDQTYGVISKRADAASKIQSAISGTINSNTRAAGAAQIDALISGGAKTPGAFVPTKGDN